MSSSIWARAARTCFIRPRVGSGTLLGRSYILLTAKPVSNVLLRPIPLITRQQSSAVAFKTEGMETDSSQPAETTEEGEQLPQFSSLETDSPRPAEATEKGEQLPQYSSLENVLHSGTFRALTRGPFQLTTMSPVQAAVLPLLPELIQPHNPENPSSRDLMVKAKTGTGKTLAFLIPALEARLKVLEEYKKVKLSGVHEIRMERAGISGDSIKQFASAHTGVVIISPTRELATQIANEAAKLVEHLKSIEVHLFVGGEDKRRQLKKFRYGRADIVVATPGRLNDVLESSEEIAASLAKTQTFILDEADTLLDMGFMPDIQRIIKHLPPSPIRQTFLFSATLSPAIRKIASESLSRDHRYINCVSDDAPPTHAHIPQYHTVLPAAEDQIPHILRLLAHDQLTNPGKSKTIVFLPTTKMTALFAQLLMEMKKDILPAGVNSRIFELHSQRSQEARVRTSDAFRADSTGASVLVTSDVSARGVDYPGVTRVIQVGVPKSGELYVHRVGRTGRAGTQGRGDLVILPFECKFLSTQMKHVPLKPLTVDEHTSQLLEIAKKYDADPKAFWGGEIPMIKKQIRNPGSKVPFFRGSNLVPVLEDIPLKVAETIPKGDPEVYDHAFASVIGYYIGLADEFRMLKLDVLEECKKWAVAALGIATPHISPAMMEKLGLMNERRRLDRQGERRGDERRMDGIRKRGFSAPSANSWMGRGNRKLRESKERDNQESYEPRYKQSSEGGYRSSEGGFRSSGGGYRSSEGGYRGSGGGYRSSEGGHRSSEGGYRSSEGVRRSSEGGYRSSEGGYRSSGGGFRSSEGGYQKRNEQGGRSNAFRGRRED